MKKKNFRRLSVFLLLIFVLVLTGCASTKKVNPVTTDDPTEEPTGSDTGKIKQTAVYETAGTATGLTINATLTNQNAIRINIGKLNLSNSTVTSSGKSSNLNESNLYGLNATVSAIGGTTITINDSSITSSGYGATAVFATGIGSTVTLSNLTIKTSGESARGLSAVYMGAIDMSDSTLTTQGIDSPAVYSMASISVSDSVLLATGAQAVVIDGKNYVLLANTETTGTVGNGVMIYQSTSDTEPVGTGSITIRGGSLSAKEGSLFYITNTDASISLTNTQLTGTGTLLKAEATTKWGKVGANGGNVTLTANSQTLPGNIIADKLSSIRLILKQSEMTSEINTENTAKSIILNMDATSVWNVTGNSYLNVFVDGDTTLSNINDNGFTVYYDAANPANSWLNARTIELNSGGQLTPIVK